MRILVIEDEELLATSLKRLLEKNGYACDIALDGNEGLFCAMEYPLDLAVIDIGLPGKDGIEIISALRAADIRYPILLLTARDRWQDKVQGLEAGADDYLTKPFQTEELLARLNALLRRSSGAASSLLNFDFISIDTAARTLSLHGQPVELTAYEYRVLECLALNAGSVLSKSYLAERVYDEDVEHDSNTIEVFVGRLRKKIKVLTDQSLIATVRGEGYRFIPPII